MENQNPQQQQEPQESEEVVDQKMVDEIWEKYGFSAARPNRSVESGMIIQ